MFNHTKQINYSLLVLIFFSTSKFLFAQDPLETEENYTREWGTYFASPFYISLDGNGDLWVANSPTSDRAPFKETSGLITEDAYQSAFGGGSRDALLMKLSPEGELLYGTFFGGEGLVSVTSLSVENDQVYMAGQADISLNIATPGAYQETSNEVSRTAYIAKFDDEGDLEWATYLAGNRVVSLVDTAVDSNGNLYFFGSTRATDLATQGAFKETVHTFLNNDDEEVASSYLVIGKFTNNGSLDWLTYYTPDWMANEDNQSSFQTQILRNNIEVDESDNLIVVGMTLPSSVLINPSDDGFYASQDAFQPNSNGQEDIFLSKFDTNGNRLWSTYFGGDGRELNSYFHISPSDDIFVTFSTTSSDLATSGVLQEELPSTNSLFASKFDSSNGDLIWGTYLDLDVILQTVTCSSNFKGDMVLAFNTTENNYITEEAWSTEFNEPIQLQLLSLSTDGSSVNWSSYYGSQSLTPFLTYIERMPDNSFYFTGLTNSNTEIATEGTFAQNRIVEGGAFNGFVAKFVPCQQVPQPVLESPQEFNEGQTLADIELTPIEWTGSTPVYTWYADEEGENELSENTALQNGEVYYLGMQIRGCPEAFYPVQIGTLSTVDEDFFELSIYPNPTRGEINIQAKLTEEFSVKIFSLQGKLMLEEHLSVNTANHYKISTDQILSKGMYLIQLESQGKHQIKKLMVE